MNFNSLDISASALHAQRTRMDAIASNLANINTTRNPDGTAGVYRRKQVIFSAVYADKTNQTNQDFNTNNGILKGSVSQNDFTASGVKVLEVQDDYSSPLKRLYNPSHPDSDKDGYVNMPNVDMVTEMVDMISASRAYEANVTTITATKSMISAALKI